ncbi:hypothetical protein BLOT_016222 [Blomia tropicalis]|nr:hypothetical protein BLOT_016222 [Blomia tropicalis]
MRNGKRELEFVSNSVAAVNIVCNEWKELSEMFIFPKNEKHEPDQTRPKTRPYYGFELMNT